MRLLIRVSIVWCLIISGVDAEDLPRVVYISPIDTSDLFPVVHIWVKTKSGGANERPNFGLAWDVCKFNDWGVEGTKGEWKVSDFDSGWVEGEYKTASYKCRLWSRIEPK